MIARKTDPTTIPWIAWTAGRISDPVLRLRFLQTAAPAWQPRASRKLPFAACLLAVAGLLIAGDFALARRPPNPVFAMAEPISPKPAEAAAVRSGSTQEIWQVEKIASSESYSNGLQIENKFSTGNHPRSYLAFAAVDTGGAADQAGRTQASTTPVGIVYHTTESLLAPFEPEQNGKLKKVGESLLEYVRRRKAYNFVIDRFGRVFRVVQEEDAADHAGYSVWADDKWIYVNLNESFLGVAVETQTQPGQLMPQATAAQIRGTAMLTEMLRSRYGIPAGNCVTHAQVSVNPTRMLAGYHMDWASSFPFAEIGLPDNYALPLPSVAEFGFEWDASYSRAAGSRLAEGAILGARKLAQSAAEAGVTVDAYRKILQTQYRNRLAATRHTVVSREGA